MQANKWLIRKKAGYKKLEELDFGQFKKCSTDLKYQRLVVSERFPK
jgi:hypothetical protein